MTVRVAAERADQPDAVRLVEELDAYQKPLYPLASFHGVDLAALAAPGALFAMARDAAGAAVGCGAVVFNDGWAELKRMFVRPACRGAGVGRRIVEFLELRASQRGCTVMRLETGVSQPEALALYARAGYAPRGPFAAYGPDPLSVFMEKRIVAGMPG